MSHLFNKDQKSQKIFLFFQMNTQAPYNSLFLIQNLGSTYFFEMNAFSIYLLPFPPPNHLGSQISKLAPTLPSTRKFSFIFLKQFFELHLSLPSPNNTMQFRLHPHKKSIFQMSISYHI